MNYEKLSDRQLLDMAKELAIEVSAINAGPGGSQYYRREVYNHMVSLRNEFIAVKSELRERGIDFDPLSNGYMI